MQPHHISQIQSMPEFHALIERRRRVIVPLTIISLVSYFGFILAVAFLHETMSIKLGDVTTLGIVLGLGLIFLTFIITGIYTYIASNQIAPLLQAIRNKVQGD